MSMSTTQLTHRDHNNVSSMCFKVAQSLLIRTYPSYRISEEGEKKALYLSIKHSIREIRVLCGSIKRMLRLRNVFSVCGCTCVHNVHMWASVCCLYFVFCLNKYI